MIRRGDPWFGQVATDHHLRIQLTKFRNFFLGSEEGRQVFEFLHEELGTFDSIPNPTPQQAALHAFGLRLLELVGVNHEDSLGLVIQKLSELPPVWAAMEVPNDEESAR
jgi:hypothetical protein